MGPNRTDAPSLTGNFASEDARSAAGFALLFPLCATGNTLVECDFTTIDSKYATLAAKDAICRHEAGGSVVTMATNSNEPEAGPAL
jgi:hypothetical protein